MDLLARETQITSGVRLVSSSLTTILSEEREDLDQLQHLTERRDQLVSSLTSAQTALLTAQGRVEQLQREMMEPGEIMSDAALASLEEEVSSLERRQQEAMQHVESLRLDRVRLETRITMLRKQSVWFCDGESYLA